MFDAPTTDYLRGGSARTFRRTMGQAMTKEDFARDEDARIQQMNQMKSRQKQMDHQQRLARMEQQTQFGVADREGEAAAGVAEIGREQAFGVADRQGSAAENVADRQGSAAENVAGINAGASRYGSSMDVLGQTIDSVGGVVGSWLTRGVEEMRRDGNLKRIEKMAEEAGWKGGGIYQDATGRAMPMQQPMEVGTKPIFDETGQKQIGREITLPSGGTKTQLFKESAAGADEWPPFTPGTSEYDDYWGKADGDADESDTAQTTDAKKPSLVSNAINATPLGPTMWAVKKMMGNGKEEEVQLPMMNTPQEAMQTLKPGDQFVTKDGRILIVPNKR